jgi:hypothetical protein
MSARLHLGQLPALQPCLSLAARKALLRRAPWAGPSLALRRVPKLLGLAACLRLMPRIKPPTLAPRAWPGRQELAGARLPGGSAAAGRAAGRERRRRAAPRSARPGRRAGAAGAVAAAARAAAGRAEHARAARAGPGPGRARRAAVPRARARARVRGRRPRPGLPQDASRHARVPARADRPPERGGACVCHRRPAQAQAAGRSRARAARPQGFEELDQIAAATVQAAEQYAAAQQPDADSVDTAPGRQVVKPPVAPGAFAADRAAVQAAARARAQPAP